MGSLSVALQEQKAVLETMAAVFGNIAQKIIPSTYSAGSKYLLKNVGSLYYGNGGSRGYAAKWQLDPEWAKQFEGPVLIPPEGANIQMPAWNSRLAPAEKKVRNLTINFG